MTPKAISDVNRSERIESRLRSLASRSMKPEYSDDLCRAADLIEQQQAELARLRMDAERMDFLDTLRRDVVGTDYNGEPELLCHAWVVEMQHSEIRPALDELMAATAPKQVADSSGRAEEDGNA